LVQAAPLEIAADLDNLAAEGELLFRVSDGESLAPPAPKFKARGHL
jgi:hypothetical protein